ncbi:Nitroreductase-like protein [Dunaliella salina]|uniref:Nitroreductase-like protein n=1 Tax=Dunaliella salina TaxID=3046 RepID=A0ABQ7GC01_DUNSA|nr:Nitroreductase-like protein [Dunaliella salina]|eukprot:KAF5832135.1 Nitroreductase-like protein [Dunaliella salina]
MPKQSLDVDFVLSRRDISSPSAGGGSTELLLFALLILSFILGFVFEDAKVAVSVFFGGAVLWVAFKTTSKVEPQPSDARNPPSIALTQLPARQEPLPSAEATLALIKSQRSFPPGDYNGQKLSRPQLEMLLEASNWAPTLNLTQPWRFVVLGGSSKTEFEQLAVQMVEKYTEPREQAAKAAEHVRVKAATAWPLVSHYLAIILSPCPSNPEWEDLASVACAVQNIGLQATAMGIAGYWTSWEAVARDAQEMREFLGLTEPKDRCLGLYCLGFSDRSAGYRSSRGTVQEKVQWRL